MSTKIYNGYQLGNMTLLQLHQFTQKVRAKITEVTEELFKQLLAKKIADFVDLIFLQPSLDDVRKWFEEEFGDTEETFDATQSLEHLIFWGVAERVEKTKKSLKRDTEYDLDVSFVLMPIRGKVLALFYAEQDAYREAWESFPEVQPYPYWDNTDPDESVTEKEWNQRERDWKKAWKRGVAAENGFVVECFLRRPFITPGSMLNLVPPFEKRVRKLAKNAVLHRKLQEEHNKDPQQAGFPLFWKAIDWINTEEGQKALEEEKARIAALIPKTITTDILEMKIQDLHANKAKFL